MSHPDSHPDIERIQAFLDRRLGAETERAVRAHLSECARCRAEVESWRTLFVHLSEMPRIAPSPTFRKRVVEAVELPSKEGVLQKIRRGVGELLPSWVPGGSESARGPDGHLGTRVLLGYLDRALPPRVERAVARHADGCHACRAELAHWRSVVERIESVGHTPPPPGFADAVMARVRGPAAGRQTARGEESRSLLDRTRGLVEGVAGQVERFRPRTRRGWAVAGISALAPVIGAAAATAALFTSHPLLTPASLASFLWWQISGLVQGMAAVVADRVLASPVALEIWRAVEGISAEPLMAGAGAVAFGLTSVASLWILYRNLAAAPPADRGYVNVSA